MVHFTLLQKTPTYIIAIIIFCLLIALYFLGYSIRKRSIEKNPDRTTIDLTAINGMLLGLLGLLLAFTFSMASSRFDTRRELVIEEANDIGTVILRTDLYPDSMRQLLRRGLKEYVNERIAHYEAGMDLERAIIHYNNAGKISNQIWTAVASFAQTDNLTTRTPQMVPALNAMIDITTTRRAAGESTVPDPILYFLFILCLCSAFLLGYDNKHKKIDWIVVLGFGIMLSITVYMIIDLDRPRSGLINMDVPNQKMVELREMF